MVARAVAATALDQRDGWKADTEGVGLEASIYPDMTQTGELWKPEECQQLQPERQPKPVPMPKPNPNPSPKPHQPPG
jgi:hypothetical protein